MRSRAEMESDDIEFAGTSVIARALLRGYDFTRMIRMGHIRCNEYNCPPGQPLHNWTRHHLPAHFSFHTGDLLELTRDIPEHEIVIIEIWPHGAVLRWGYDKIVTIPHDKPGWGLRSTSAIHIIP